MEACFQFERCEPSCLPGGAWGGLLFLCWPSHDLAMKFSVDDGTCDAGTLEEGREEERKAGRMKENADRN